MIYNVKAFDLCILKIASTITEKLIDLKKRWLKSKNEKVNIPLNYSLFSALRE